MRIVCDRCQKKTVRFDDRDKWMHIETSEKSYGKLGDYYLCPECSDAFYDFLNNRTVEQDG